MRRPLVLYLLAAAVLVGALVFTARRGDPEIPATPEPPAPRASVTPTATPEPPLPAAGKGLAVGVTEYNPNLVASPADRELPAPFAAARDALGAIKPAYYRLMIDWSQIQPSPDAPPNLDVPQTGCSREAQPCLIWAGVRDQLRALASRQREGGWQGVVTIMWTPAWAAAPASGCERKQVEPRDRPPRADALPAYRALIAAILAAAHEVGADLRFWSPWNEPNLTAFISPQRAACDPSSPSLAPAAYAEIARAMQQALDEAPGDQQLLLGETAGILKPGKRTTSVPEFIAGLPQDVVCASTVYSQHAYIGGPDPVDATLKALDARGCPEPHTIWITETGVGPAPKAYSQITYENAACPDLHKRLVSWWNDPRVTTAFQYSFREDDRFPTGLVSADLTRDLPALAEWKAWGGGGHQPRPHPRQLAEPKGDSPL